MEYSSAFVCLMGMGTVFFGLICLIVLTSLLAPARAAKDDTGDLEVEAKAALLIDPDTEELLYARNIHERLYPASLTKIMTCLLVLESLDRGDRKSVV